GQGGRVRHRDRTRRKDRPRRPVLVDRLSTRIVAPSLLGGALAAWIVTADRMRGMDGGPGTTLGAVGWYLGIWATMMAAMMLPTVTPVVLLFDRAARQQ